EARAAFEGAEHATAIRIAEHQGSIFLDLANDRWEGVEINPTGWSIVSVLPVKFRRPKGLAPLPCPQPGGSIDLLRPFINVSQDSDWRLVLAWVLTAMRPKGPYPVLTLYGEQGSGKSTLVRVLRSLFDPNSTPLRAEPREVRDLMIGAWNAWCLALDNVSHLPPWLSDSICRLATGGGFATRELYSDQEEVLFDAQRPILLNGIQEMGGRSDLLDRSLIIYLPSIPEERRRTEANFWSEFEEARPRILGALLDTLSAALRELPSVKLARTPRMADFCQWATAAETALGWNPGSFLEVYTGNRGDANALVLESNPLASEIMALDNEFVGTISDLLLKLNQHAPEEVVRQSGWPKGPVALSGLLRRLLPNLRAVGIEISFEREARRGRRRLVTIRKTG
ncbi:MAG TPA: hypothetical protein VN638_08580, partial [Nitrospiraceae bacterium]|nr:hypothetical protein [Nitrospiraceae bacterium]